MEKELPQWVKSSDGYGIKRRIKSLAPALVALLGVVFGVDVGSETIMLVTNSVLVVWAVAWHMYGWFKALYDNNR